MSKRLVFTIITPCYNSGRYIEETARSVLDQQAVRNGQVELQYIICDGGSSDNTLEILESFNDPRMTIISGKDEGMYDALVSGFAQATGDICAYLNAGDFYSPQALGVVADVMQDDSIQWLTGINFYYNDKSQVVATKLPYRYTKANIMSGRHGRLLPHIQQESTFWKAELMKSLDIERLRSFKLAGDSFLWWSFAKQKANLYIVESYLGGFRVHNNQLSSQVKDYDLEVKSFATPSILSYPHALFCKFMWHLPSKLKKLLNPRHLLRYNFDNEKWE